MIVSYDAYRVFYTVARFGSFTKAASVLLASQPNLTRTIRNLESALGCTLFVRSNRGVSLTPEGEKLFARVSVACEQIQAGEEELASDRSLQSGVVSIGASETALHGFLLPVLGAFHRAYPAFAHGRLTDDRHAHAHVAAQIIDVVNAAVQNRVGRSAVHLRIDDAGQVRAAFGGEKAPHLNRQFTVLGQRAQIRRKLTKRRKRVAVILVIEIRKIQPRPVFHAHGFKAVCRFQFLSQFGQHRQLFALAVELLALCAGKIMHALDADVRRIGAAVKRGEEIPLVHAELRTRRQPEQNGINPAARARRFVNQADVQR